MTTRWATNKNPLYQTAQVPASIVLAIRVDDRCMLIDAQARIVAEMSLAPSAMVTSSRVDGNYWRARHVGHR